MQATRTICHHSKFHELLVCAERETSSMRFTVGTSNNDGHMYFVMATLGYELSLTQAVRLDDENRDAIASVLGPTETWTGVIR